MKAVIKLDVPVWQIDQDVMVYFPDMMKHGRCELLEEQEASPVIVEERKIIDEETDDGIIFSKDLFYHCPSCNYILSRTYKDKDIRFCSRCGQAVKWDA